MYIVYVCMDIIMYFLMDLDLHCTEQYFIIRGPHSSSGLLLLTEGLILSLQQLES